MAEVDVEAIADVVVSLMQRAISPVVADVKTLQIRLAEREALASDLAAVRERLAVIEAKDFVSRNDLRDAMLESEIDPDALLSAVIRKLQVAA